ncbi:hypothetical protein FDECE_11655 [Fusarium decemcellulare]|nr:hypothetical protein FDECE_11655 [Fusarium decemcellulare]
MSPQDPSWIAWDGPYQDQINGLCASDPRLSQPDTRNPKYCISWETRQVNIRTIEFGFDQSDETLLSPVAGPDSLAKRLARERAVDKPRRTAYIFEGMNRDVATVLGNHFRMDPSLFTNYERTANCASTNDGSYSALATSLATQSYLSLPYRDLFALPSGLLGYFRLGCSHTGRGGLYLPRNYLGIVICDPPLRNVMIKDEGPTEGQIVPVSLKPIGGGYIDFLPADTESKAKRGPPRTGIADDLCFYLTNHSRVPGLTWDSPGNVAIFVKKIIVSHYSRHLDQLRRIIMQSQKPMRRHSDFKELGLAAVEANWSDCQTLEKRLHQYCLDLEDILFQMRLPLERPDPRQITSWQDVGADFQMLHYQFDHARTWVGKFNSSISALTGIAGNRQAFREQQVSLQAADRARNITILGLVFVPLAYVATLFSMSDGYAPGEEKFWMIIPGYQLD